MYLTFLARDRDRNKGTGTERQGEGRGWRDRDREGQGHRYIDIGILHSNYIFSTDYLYYLLDFITLAKLICCILTPCIIVS